MNPNRLLALGVSALAALTLASSAKADDLREIRTPRSGLTAPSYRDGEVIVRFRDGLPRGVRTSMVREAGGDHSREGVDGETLLVRLAPGISVDEAIRRFSGMREVAFAERNGILRKVGGDTFVPDDKFFKYQWNLKMLNAERIWAIQKGKSSVAVAVLDSGVAYEDRGPYRKAKDFGGTVFLPGYDFINDDPYPNDDDGHGTHVASTIAEATNNAEGVAGLAFGCAILPVKVLDSVGEGSFFDIAQGVDFAASFSSGGDKPVKVINMSLGGGPDDFSETLKRSIEGAVSKGVLVVVATGNDADRVAFPANLDKALAVGAVDGRKQVASYSNFGKEVDLVAPGGDCDRDDDNDGFGDCVYQQTFDPRALAAGRYDQFCYCGLDGTSMATPHVAAAAALLYSQGITDPAAVRAALQQTADPLGAKKGERTDETGFGLIQPSIALSGLGLGQGFPQN